MRINPTLFDLPKEKQEKIREDFDYELDLVSRHCALVHFMNHHIDRPDSYRSIDDPLYREPTAEEITEVIDHLAEIHSLGVVSKQLGLKSKSNPTRTLNRWKSGENEIPYPAWRLLLVLDGRVVEVNRIPDADGQKAWAKFY
ncbi:hypothetical protein DZ860_20910 [Vibrio sinensis]|uniref:Uncharacterized protein n=1 Tax=Vibrio sinensis TaxID=2302434 RepID=A0A3A6QW07_9VIBR|nr:hypothetical protein [Vibrio sinensis]RJX65824.1 hypothetical protein DZ860_20910 [Vibrio sinensis]